MTARIRQHAYSGVLHPILSRPHARATVLAAIVVLLLLGPCSCGDHAGSSASTLPHLRRVPAFSWVNQDGSTVSDASLRGKVWVAYFFFTSCGGPCPRMNTNAAGLQARCADIADFRIVGFTVDPAHDTLKRLSAYAARYGVRPGRWYMLRTTEASIGAFAADGFAMGDRADPIMHGTHFALVDADGVIRGYYNALDRAALDTLSAAIHRLTRSGA